MKIKNLSDEDFVNYKLPSMFIITPYCDFKCEKECGIQCCQNSDLVKQPTIEYSIDKIISRYLNNPITKAVVLGGMEPLIDNYFIETLNLIASFRKVTDDPIVIYTGYYPNEIPDKLKQLSGFKNIIIKFGRFIPNDESRFDEVLGVTLASKNQYAQRIEDVIIDEN